MFLFFLCRLLECLYNFITFSRIYIANINKTSLKYKFYLKFCLSVYFKFFFQFRLCTYIGKTKQLYSLHIVMHYVWHEQIYQLMRSVFDFVGQNTLKTIDFLHLCILLSLSSTRLSVPADICNYNNYVFLFINSSSSFIFQKLIFVDCYNYE